MINNHIISISMDIVKLEKEFAAGDPEERHDASGTCRKDFRLAILYCALYSGRHFART